MQPWLAEKLSAINFADCIVSDFMKHYVYFLIGVYCFEEMERRFIKERIKETAVIFGAVLLIGNIGMYARPGINTMPYRFFISIAGILFIVCIARILQENKILAYLGRQTLTIYVLQGFAIAASRLALTKLHLNDAWGIIPLIVCTSAGILLPLAAYNVSARIGWLDGVFYPGKYIRL